MAVVANPHFTWRSILSALVFLMFALNLAVPGGYSFGPSALLLVSFVLVLPKRLMPISSAGLRLNSRDLWLIATFAAYFLALTAEVAWFHLKLRELDKPLRFLLAIPIVLLLLRCPPRVTWMWGGVVLSALSAGTFAMYQKLWLGLDRAEGFLYPIQFGDLSMLMGVLCLAGIAWGQEQKYRAGWIFAFALGAAMGVGASLLSGSRGGWIGAPLIFLMLIRNYSNFLSRAQWTGLITGICMCGAAVVAVPETGIARRIHQIYVDVHDYRHGENNTSLGARFDLWRMANYMYGHRPIFGYGAYGFVAMRNEIHEKFGYGQGVISQDLQSAHNEILDAAAKRGSIGVLALLGVYLVPLVLFSRFRHSRDMTTRSLALGGAMIPVCFMDFGMSQVLFTHNDAVMVYPYAIAVFWACLRNRQAQLRWTNSGFLPASK